MAALGLSLVGCENSNPDEGKQEAQPTIALEKGIEDVNSVSFTIITTDATGCRETVTNGENGYLVPVKDIDALSGAMIDLIEKPELISQMADKGLELVKQKFDVKIVNNTINTTMKL